MTIPKCNRCGRVAPEPHRSWRCRLLDAIADDLLEMVAAPVLSVVLAPAVLVATIWSVAHGEKKSFKDDRTKNTGHLSGGGRCP